MKKQVLLVLLLMLLLTGCRRYSGFLPYAREIEDMELIRTLGVDGAGETGVAITASGGTSQEETEVVSGEAGTISAAVLELQGEGSSYLYFGHVTQLLLGEELVRRGVMPSLDYVLRDVEMRLETALYVVRNGTAGQAIEAAAADGSATDRLEALADDAGLTANSMPRTVKDVLAELDRQGASFLPAVLADDGLTAAGYGILKDGALVGWAEGDAALGVNLIFGKVDADVVEVQAPNGTAAALRVVGAAASVRPIWQGDTLAGLKIHCKVDANLAEGSAMPDQATLDALEAALAQVEAGRMAQALELSRALDADYLGLRQSAAFAVPWHKGVLLGSQSMKDLKLEATAEAVIQRSYHADG
ncbi:Ger(x)C family spore germination C-terminal domain-containing protein [Flavonifractor plautii]|uniref:Ger(x)C family spore germination protein n=1 Tax=Flavonifractor plautii TaxID=292800 RepID=UPI00195D88C3|nr:spore gernimation protein GerC [Flavonifractor plautii]